MRIIGIDPGLKITGYGIIELIGKNPRVIEAGVIRTNPREKMEKRLVTIYNELNKVFDDVRPDVVAIEDLYSHYKRPRTAIIMGHARGVVCLLVAIKDIPLISYSPSKVKNSIVGYGRASKEQVQSMIKNVLNLPTLPKPDDVSDALAVALCHVNNSR